MQQALTFPALRSIAIGSILLALTVVGAGAASSTHGRRMVLHAVEQPGAVYLSAWRNGDVPVPFKGERLVPLTYETLASVSDGCRWLGTETLTPLDERRYFYRYSETILECDPGATPCYKTPRTGIVTIEE
jgi:hypothetical protein